MWIISFKDQTTTHFVNIILPLFLLYFNCGCIDNWVKCDDEEMTPVSADEVKKLSGGGDWHIAYLLLYGPRRMDKYQAEVAVEAIKVAAQSTAMES